MRTATPALVLSLAVALLVAEACKKDDETAAVPDAEAPAAVVDAAAPPPPETPATTPPTPVPPTPQPTPQRDAGATDAGKTDAGATDAGKTDAGTAGGGNIQACLAKCQAIVASCLTPQAGKDGGLPTLGDPTKCKAAGDACQAACKP